MPPSTRPDRAGSTPRRAAGGARGGARSSPAGRAAGSRRRIGDALRDFPWRRWMAVLICVAVLLIGVPLAHALVGDLGALLLLVGTGGFALGRATARPIMLPQRKGRSR